MARLFDDIQEEYLGLNQAVFTSLPSAMVARFNSNDIEQGGSLFCMGASDSDEHYQRIVIRSSAGGNTVLAQSHAVGVSSSAETTVGYTVNTWQHACGIFASPTDRRILLDGGSKGTATLEVTPTGLDLSSIGVLNALVPRNYMSGMIAEVAIYDLSAYPGATDSDKADYFEANILPHLAAGEPPGDYTTGLVAYWPLRDDDLDYADDFDLTPINTPSWAEHPTVLHLLDGTIEAQSGITGNLKSLQELAGLIEAQSGATGNLHLTLLQELAGLIEAQSALTGAIDLVLVYNLAGLIAAQSSLSGDIYSIWSNIPPLMHRDIIDPYGDMGGWLWLVEIVVPTQATQRIARNTETVVYGGTKFPKGNFDVGRIPLVGDGSIPRIQLQIAQDETGTLEDIVNATKGGENGTVKLIRTCEKYFNSPVKALERTYDILTAGSDFQWVIFSLGIPNALTQRIPLWSYSSKVCPLATPSLFKGPRCQYDGDDVVCTGLFEDCRTKGNAVHWGAEIGLDPNAVRI